MLQTKEQWDSWLTAIIEDIASSGVNEDRQSLANKLAELIGFESETKLLATTPLKIDLYPSLLGQLGVIGTDLESQFHEYVNRNSYFDENDLLAPKRNYYPPCRSIFSLLPKGITLSPSETEWYWTKLIMNAPISFDEELPPLLGYAKYHRHLTMTTANDNQMLVEGDIEPTVINQVNEVYLNGSHGRFEPLIIRKPV